MQVKFGEFNAIQNEDIQQIHPDEIAGYVIQRSPASHFLFDVYMVNQKGELLVCVDNDLSFEEATAKVDIVNTKYFPVIPTPTEIAFIEVGGESKVYNITSK